MVFPATCDMAKGGEVDGTWYGVCQDMSKDGKLVTAQCDLSQGQMKNEAFWVGVCAHANGETNEEPLHLQG